jgi:ribose transport system permease protein
VVEAGELRQDAVDPSATAYTRLAGVWLRGQGVLIALILVFLFGAWRYGDKFTSSFNLWTLAKNNTYFALIALGMTFVIMTGGIDLSVGAVVALSAVTAARLSPHGLWIALGAAIGIGLLVGVINGGIIAVFKVQPFIVTLALLLGARGAALNLSHNASVSVDYATNYKDRWKTEFGPVPLPVVIVVVAYLLGSIVLNLTRFGRHILAIGGNEEAARLAGLPINRTLFFVYLLSGGLAGLAGALLAAQGNTGSPIAAVGWELTAIAAVVVGGTLLTGGRGSVWTTLVGVLLLGLIFNELNYERGKGIFDLTQYWEEVIRGLFLLIVIILQARLTNTARVTRSM